MKVDNEFKEAMNRLDEIYSVTPPNKRTLSASLEEKMAQHKQKQTRELFLFMLTALMIVFLFMMVFIRMPVIYVVIQITSFIFVPIYVWYKNRMREREGHLS